MVSSTASSPGKTFPQVYNKYSTLTCYYCVIPNILPMDMDMDMDMDMVPHNNYPYLINCCSY